MLDLTGYKLTFDDEFNSLSISQGSSTRWSDIRGDMRLNAHADIGYGAASFLDGSSGYNPFALKNGALEITAVAPGTNPSALPGNWSSGLIHSAHSFAQQYGYFEMRADMPADLGVWPAFWLLPSDKTWPPEADIIEYYGDDYLYSWTHTRDPSSNTNLERQAFSKHPEVKSGFHTFGLEWTPTTLTYYFDGEITGVQKTPSDFHRPMYLVANLGMQHKPGMNMGPHSMQIDYIRAYSADESAKQVALDTVSSPDGADTMNLYGTASTGQQAGSQPIENQPAPEPTPPVQSAQSDLVLRVSGDHYLGNPQFEVFVDGRQAGGRYEATAIHAKGEWQDVRIPGPSSEGAHQVEIRFTNDLWDGRQGEGHDRNLYIDELRLGTQVIDGPQVTRNTGELGHGFYDAGAAVMVGNGVTTFELLV